LRRLTATIVLLLAAVLYAGCAQGDKKIVLRYKFEPGTKCVYEQVSKRSSSVMQDDSTTKKSSMTFEVNVEQFVKRILDENTAEIVEISTWRFEKPNKNDSSIIDTVEERRELILHVQPNGKVRNVEFSVEENYTNIQYIKNYYEQGMPVFPSGELSVGDSWTQTTKVVLPGETMEASMNYEIASLVREAGYDCAVIEYDGNIIIPIESSPQDSVQRSGVDRINSAGRLYFAYREGMVVLQREQWLINRERKTTCSEGTKEYKEAIELDITFALKQRSIIDSLSL